MRHEFTKATKRQALARSGGRCEAIGEVYGLPFGQRCNAPLEGKSKEYDHYPDPAGDPNSDRLDNCVVCCKDCHARKTASYDIPMQAKGVRIRDKHNGIRPPSRLSGPGFRKAPPQHTALRPIIRRSEQ